VLSPYSGFPVRVGECESVDRPRTRSGGRRSSMAVALSSGVKRPRFRASSTGASSASELDAAEPSSSPGSICPCSRRFEPMKIWKGQRVENVLLVVLLVLHEAD